MAVTWKSVRVFISSTFRDMHAERDHLVKVVFPKLRAELEPHRIHLIDIDLRWGVTKEQADNDQTLGLCLQLIDRCRPFFVGILGERYGWLPKRFPADALQTYGWIQDQTGKSVTELEIIHGVLRNSQMRGHAFFYFRDPNCVQAIPEALRRTVYVESDATLVEKLAELKKDIRSSGYPVTENYSARWDPDAEDRLNKSRGCMVDLEEFGQRVYRQLRDAIRAEHPVDESPASAAAADWLAEEADFHERFLESRLPPVNVYVGRVAHLEDLLRFAAGPDTVPCLLTGPAGAGKSALLARFVDEFRARHRDALVLPHFVGAGPRSTELRDVLRRCCHTLKNQFNLPDEISEETARLSVTFRELLGKVPVEKRVLIVIDALNQLDETDRARHLEWLPAELPPHVKLVVSCIEVDGKAEPVLEAIRRRRRQHIAVSPLADDERREIIRQAPLLSAKTLNDTQIDLLLKNPATANPLFLLTALEELRTFGSFEQLNEEIGKLPREGDTVTAIFTQVIERLEADFAAETVRTVLTLLASARRGLSERELLDLVEGPGVALESSGSDLFPILRQLRSCLLSRGGLLGFYHGNLLQAVRERYFAADEPRRRAHERLAEYFEAQNNRLESRDDRQRPDEAPTNVRKMDELPWQWMTLRAWPRLHAVIGEPNFFLLLWEVDPFDARRYWAALEANSAYRAKDTFRGLLDDPNPDWEVALAVGELLSGLGAYQEVVRLWQHLATGASGAKQTPLTAVALGNAGLTLHVLGDLQTAGRLLAKVTEYWRGVGQPTALQIALGNQAINLTKQGAYEEALALHQEEEQICRENHLLNELQTCLGNQGVIFLERQEIRRALELFKEQESLCHGNVMGRQLTLCNQALAYYHLGDFEQASTILDEQQSLCHSLGYLYGLQVGLGVKTKILLAQKNTITALVYARQRVKICEDSKLPDGLIKSLIDEAAIHSTGLGDLDRARQCLIKALALAESQGLDRLREVVLEQIRRLDERKDEK